MIGNIKIENILLKVSKYCDLEAYEAIRVFTHELFFSKSANTIISYLYDLLIGIKFFHEKLNISTFVGLISMQSATFRALLAEQKSKGVSQPSQQRLLCSWRGFLKKYGGSGLSEFRAHKFAKRYPKPVSKETVEKILAISELDFSLLRNKALWLLMYTSGMRVSEALALKFTDIREKVAKVLGKGGQERLVPITVSSITLLNKYAAFRRGMKLGMDFIFTDKKNRPLSQQGASHSFRRWKDSQGVLEKCTIHSLRHGFATHILKNGCPLTAIQKTLGHKNLFTTTQYLKIEDQYLESEFIKRFKSR